MESETILYILGFILGMFAGIIIASVVYYFRLGKLMKSLDKLLESIKEKRD